MAHWLLGEKDSAKTGVSTQPRTAILLERQNDDEFHCLPSIRVTPNLGSRLVNLFAARESDDPVEFDSRYELNNLT